MAEDLAPEVRRRAREAFRQWMKDPRYPSLRMKKVHSTEEIWSVRIDLDHRALGVIRESRMIWFWIGKHE
ncbi:MAG: hypothetical protein NTZ01_00770, partial [Verrucomicrobia bacterium]|nr:hypothetical protein [Verrucomicrobiota bacterium]